MNLADLSIKRPIFVTCLVLLILVLGFLSMQKLGVDLFPNVTFPVVTVSTPYPGAGPSEVETLISKVFEDEISTIAGIKRLRSINKEGISVVVAEFTLETDVKYAEQQVRDKAASARRKIPKDAKESIIRRIDPADQPVLQIAYSSNLPEGELFKVADTKIRPKIEQINQVGLVEVIGGRKREIRVELDRRKLRAYDISASQVTNRIAAAGMNIPAGKVAEGKLDTVMRTLGEFKSLKDIENTIVNFVGNDVPVSVKDVGHVADSLEDEKSRTFYNGQKALLLMVFRQSGANTIAVTDAVRKKVGDLEADLKKDDPTARLLVVSDTSKYIRANVDDVRESIFIGILLTIIVVYFFLGSGRSTIITGLALPNSLLGAFILMAMAGFTINVMTLLALSLAVGLLIDDAIVVRENIFRHIEMGSTPLKAASEGTKEVMLAVLATTLAVLAVFGPIAFLQGVVGQFFREFGMTICFAMAISLFDALTVAPMLSAYFAGSSHGPRSDSFYGRTLGALLKGFDRFQTGLEHQYEKLLRFSIRRPLVILAVTFGVVAISIACVKAVPKTFLGAQDMGEFMASLELSPGTNLSRMTELATEVDQKIRENKEVKSSVMIVGNRDGEANVASFYLELVPRKQRTMNTSQFKDILREQLKPYAEARPIVKDIDMVAAGMRPFNVNIVGNDLNEVEKYANALFEKLKVHPALKDADISHKPGKPEFQIVTDNQRAEQLGVSSSSIGAELRNLVEGSTPSVFREQGEEYDIRVRLQEDQRNLKESFNEIYVPNINYRLIKLSNVASPVDTTGPATINRQDRGRYISIGADIAPGGPGMGGAMEDIAKFFATESKLPPGMSYGFVGQAENFKELIGSMIVATLLAVIFIYLVLASLYESFITPFTIMLVLPLAICGAFIALFVTRQSLDMNSMIGCVMLLGVATKNSILLVDYANQLLEQGVERGEAIVRSGKARLRPILMTTFALIAGMLPVAIGLNEASRQRMSIGISVIGGLISSTALSLVVVPACFSYIDRFRVWSKAKAQGLFQAKA